jgi:hypothetical protein
VNIVERPFPSVGSKVRKFYGEGNPSSWLRFGEVLAAVENEAMLIKRWLPLKKRFVYEAITVSDWSLDVWEIRKGKHESPS